MANQILRDSEVAVLRKLEQLPDNWFYEGDRTASGLPELKRLKLIEQPGPQALCWLTASDWQQRRLDHVEYFPKLLPEGSVRWVDKDGNEKPADDPRSASGWSICLARR